MFKIEFLKLNLGGVVLRYYLLMMMVIAAGFTGMWWLGLLALPIFLSAILGITVGFKKTEKAKVIKHQSVQRAEAA